MTSAEGIRTEKQTRRKEVESQHADPLEPGEIPQLREVEAPGSSKEANEDPLLPETDLGEEMDEGSSSSSLHTIPIKNPRGRKSKKKKREEETYLAVLEGSQKTLKGIMHTRSKKGTAPALKEANPPPKVLNVVHFLELQRLRLYSKRRSNERPSPNS